MQAHKRNYITCYFTTYRDESERYKYRDRKGDRDRARDRDRDKDKDKEHVKEDRKRKYISSYDIQLRARETRSEIEI